MGTVKSHLNEDGDTSLKIENDELKKMPPPSEMTFINAKNVSNSTATTSTTVSTLTPYSQLSPRTPYTPWNINKIIQRVVSDRIIELAANFWCNNVDVLSMKDRLDLGCSIFFLTSTKAQKILSKKCKTAQQLESISLKFLDMIGYVVRSATLGGCNSNSDLLWQLGQLHEAMGVNIECYAAVLKQTHDVFQFYFPTKYTEEVKFAFDEMFTYCTMQMTGKDLKILYPSENTIFLNSIRACIKSTIGRQYLFRYLHQSYCDEMVMFLTLLAMYKTATDDANRFLIAKDIQRICINPEGVFAINISYESRQQITQNISEYEKQYGDNSDANHIMEHEFFIDAEDEICRLIGQNHWRRFKQIIHDSFIKE